METPNIAHLKKCDYDNVYEPAEDSFLLMDALEADLEFIEQQLQPTICLEIGCGSGIIVTGIAKRLKNCICLATDINPYACSATKRTGEWNGVSINCIQCNLAEALQKNSVDLLVFNPPYVPTMEEELFNNGFGKYTKQQLVNSWAGGLNGRHIINRLLNQLTAILSKRAALYLLLLRENQPHEIIDQMKQNGFDSMCIIERKIPGEHLYVIKAINNM